MSGIIVARAAGHGSLESDVAAELSKSWTIKPVDHTSPFSFKITPASADLRPITIGLFEPSSFFDSAAVDTALVFACRLAKQVNAYAIIPFSVLGSDHYFDFQQGVQRIRLLDPQLSQRPVRPLPLLPVASTAVADVVSAMMDLVQAGNRARAASTATHLELASADLIGREAREFILEGVPGVRGVGAAALGEEDPAYWQCARADMLLEGFGE